MIVCHTISHIEQGLTVVIGNLTCNLVDNLPGHTLIVNKVMMCTNPLH
jgi:hypothetical protein